jgi:predicted tellurium resistance membrane protein TerC
MAMVRLALRVLGVVLAGAASVEAFFAMCFRLEGSHELRMIERLGLDLGGVFALAFVLLFAPSRIKAPWAWLFTVAGAALIWMCVSGSLIWKHREQDRIRSAP